MSNTFVQGGEKKIFGGGLVHSKSKQLHFNVAWNDCDLKWMWSQM